MEKLKDFASYVYFRYVDEFDTKMDEMKLHKLLYFVQRESLIQYDELLFEAEFLGWKYGPVIIEIRKMYAENSFSREDSSHISGRAIEIAEKTLESYAYKDSWSLSRLSRGELSWKNSREGLSEDTNEGRPLLIEDIKKDAERIRKRREMLNGILGAIENRKREYGLEEGFEGRY